MTPQQVKLLRWLEQWFARNVHAPSVEEMRQGLGIRSKSPIHRLVLGLERQGRIVREPGRARAIRLVSAPASVVDAARALLASIVSEDLDAGTAVVKASTLGDLDLAMAEIGR